MTTQMKPKERRQQIIDEAVRQAAQVGYQNIERQKIADALGVSAALITARCGTMPELKDLVLKTVAAQASKGTYSVTDSVPIGDHFRVIAQGIVAKERRMLRLPEQVRALALQSLHS